MAKVRRMKLTADTLSDDSIRALRELCDIALYDGRTLSRAHADKVTEMKRLARAQLAVILNARNGNV